MGRQQRRQQQRRSQRQQARKQSAPRGASAGSIGLVVGSAIALVVIVALGFVLVNQMSTGAGSARSTPTTTLTPIPPSRPVDGVQCLANEQLAYHIHQHLTLYDHGRAVPLPADIGIPGGAYNANCYYWIHVHEGDPGIIHVESPSQQMYRLGVLFDIWKVTAGTTQPPGDSYVLKLQTAQKRGQVTTYVNGKLWHKSYRDVPLLPHAVITIEIGRPLVPPKPFTNWRGE
jgi:hypothetical protein